MSNPRAVLASPDGNHRVIFGDSADMTDLDDASVQLTVTSPPYPLGIDYSGGERNGDGKWEYGEAAEGQTSMPVFSYEDYERYLRGLEPIWDEVWRVTEPSGYIVVNVPIAHAAARFFGQQVCLPVPDDIARYFRQKGALYKARYIWMAIRGANNGKGERAAFMGSYLLPLEGCVIRDTEDVIVLRKPAPEGWKRSEEREVRRRQSRFADLDEWKKTFTQVWEFKGERKISAGGVEHPAPYPVELAERVIRGYSVKGDLVLDPFLGTGTTILAAKNLGRRSIGYEVEPRYESIILGRTRLLENGWSDL